MCLTCVFSSTVSSLVLLCSGVYKYHCPENRTQPLYDTAQQQVRLTNSTYNPILLLLLFCFLLALKINSTFTEIMA